MPPEALGSTFRANYRDCGHCLGVMPSATVRAGRAGSAIAGVGFGDRGTGWGRREVTALAASSCLLKANDDGFSAELV